MRVDARTGADFEVQVRGAASILSPKSGQFDALLRARYLPVTLSSVVLRDPSNAGGTTKSSFPRSSFLAGGSDDEENGLTEADRHAIAEIRRELDAEFGPLEEPRRLSEVATSLGDLPHPARPGRRQPRRRSRSRLPRRAARRGLLGMFLLGTLVGGVVGTALTLVWVHHDDTQVRSPGPDRPATHAGSASAPLAPVEPVGTVEASLAEWLDATKRGDIEEQMRFYPKRVPVYYTWRDVSREAVREEKMKVFGAASRLSITTDAPSIVLSDGGNIAVTRFRKEYVIEGPVVQRRGAVQQELRWTRTIDGWLIVGERDAKVLAP